MDALPDRMLVAERKPEASTSTRAPSSLRNVPENSMAMQHSAAPTPDIQDYVHYERKIESSLSDASLVHMGDGAHIVELNANQIHVDSLYRAVRGLQQQHNKMSAEMACWR